MGRGVLVALAGPLEAPRLLLRRTLDLTDPQAPDTGQPYHVVMDLPWDQAVRAAQATQALVARVSTQALAQVLQELRSSGHTVAAAGVAGSPPSELTRLGNRHIRTHAAEGMLFREALETAVAANGLVLHSLTDRGTEALVCQALAWPPVQLKQVLQALGQAAGPPWTAHQKLAAMLALVALPG
jgi:hypothetical protein